MAAVLAGVQDAARRASAVAVGHHDLVEPVHIKSWEAGLSTSYIERARMQAVFNTTSRSFGLGLLRELGHHPDADHCSADPEVRREGISDYARQSVWIAQAGAAGE